MKIHEKIIIIDPSMPSINSIHHAAQIISQGGMVIFPTWCLYGLAVHALIPEAVRKIFNIKKRSSENPVLILIKHQDDLNDLVTSIPAPARKIMDRFWPGKVTLVFHAKDHIPKDLTAGTGKIGIRIPEHPVAVALVHALPFPITGTSANISGTGGCNRITDLPSELTENVDLILDAGTLNGGSGSTVVDVTCNPIQIIREGAVSAFEIFRAIG